MKLTAMMFVLALGFGFGCGGIEGDDEATPSTAESLTVGVTGAATTTSPAAATSRSADENDPHGDCVLNYDKCLTKCNPLKGKGKTALRKCGTRCGELYDICVQIELD